MVEDEEDATPIEMVAWQSPETYVYAPLPPTTSYGHRAELWVGLGPWDCMPCGPSRRAAVVHLVR